MVHCFSFQNFILFAQQAFLFHYTNDLPLLTLLLKLKPLLIQLKNYYF